MAEPYGMGIGSLPLTGTSLILGCGVHALIGAITKNATYADVMGAATMAEHIASATVAQARGPKAKPE